MEFETAREKHSAEVVDRILSTTDEFISKYGIDSLTVKNLCALAGISNGTFFHYFDSKDALIAAYMQYAYDVYTQSNPFPMDSDDYMENIINRHLHNIMYSKGLGVEFIKCYYNINNADLKNRGNMTGDPYCRYILSQVESAMRAGYISPALSAETVAADICMVAKGVIFEWGLCGDSFDVEKYIVDMLRLFLRSVATPLYLDSFPDTLNTRLF